MTKFKDKMNSYKKHPGSFLLLLLVVAAAIITVACLLYTSQNNREGRDENAPQDTKEKSAVLKFIQIKPESKILWQDRSPSSCKGIDKRYSQRKE